MQFRSKPLVSLIALLPALSAHAQAGDGDAETVVVTAARVAQPRREVVGDVSVLTRKDLDARTGQTLSDILANQPGVQIATNGGPGKNASAFLRGANPQQTVVLIDGIRYSSATVGQASIQNLPLDQIERIEILRGPAASLYGADAIGGVVQVFTRQGGKETRASVELGAGNLGTREASASLSGSSCNTRYALGIAHTQTDGVSSISNPANASYNSDRDGYRNTSLSLSLSHRIDAANEIGGSVLAARARNHFDSYYTDPVSYDSVAQAYDYREQGRQGSATVWSRNRLSEIWTSRVQAGYSIDDSDSYDPVSGTDLSDSKSNFTTRQRQLGWQNELAIGPGTATLGVETLEQRIATTTAYEVDHRRINSWLAGYLAHLDAWTVQGNLRRDDNSQFGDHTTGLLGASWQLDPAWRIGTSYATGFRAPSFNDLYYPGYGDPTLKPEKSRGGEVFVRYASASLNGGLTVYRNDVRELIQYNPATYAPDNIGRARLQGATLQAGWQNGGLDIGGQYDWLDAHDTSGGKNDGKRLNRRASRSGGVHVAYRQGAWQLKSEVQAQGQRYDDPANRQRLGGYALLNLSASWQIDRNWQLVARLDNAFDRDYQQVKDYGTLGRNGLIGVRWQMR
ncbi:TonB-dependent receptor [Chitinivorax sp. PXF-14]|uniref:TonB-dependent receptor domain-containing protein n=1 Tax=Chitinivorax sp. PXF-14 TaxID=3230488 RepID=UPI003467DB10